MSNFINHLRINSKPNAVEEKNNDFDLEDHSTKLQLINNEKIISAKIDKFYKPLFTQKKCDFLIYKTEKTATFVELKGYYPIQEPKAYEQLENTILHFNQYLAQEKVFAIVAALGFIGKIKDNKNSRSFIKKTKAMLFEINVAQNKYDLNKNKPEK